MFNDDFDERFEKHMKCGFRLAAMGAVITGTLSLAGFAFAIWVVIKLMAHFGVL